ncbi:MAG: hypothetical protein JO306_14700 [Gemmatimonadetes bacterium]|nr:hypothetical protein [Gemmatimonadota bacterium]
MLRRILKAVDPRLVPPAAVLVMTVAAGCGPDPRRPRTAAAEAPPQAACEIVAKGLLLPEGLTETSGVAESRKHPGVYWTHNDSGRKPDVFAVAADGRLLGKVKVRRAENHDWEDIATGTCPEGSGSCLYISDTGNNDRRRKHVTIWVVPEPEPADKKTAPAKEYRAAYAGRPTDIEAIAVLPDGRILLVSKGNNDEIQLFRFPTPLKDDEGARLELVRRLAPNPEQIGDRVTGASASPDGRFVAVRTYAALDFYRTADLLGSGRPFAQLDLDPLAEPQGEAVTLSNDGVVVLTSEGPGHKHIPGTLSRLRCTLPRQ